MELDKYLGKTVLLNIKESFAIENIGLLQVQGSKRNLFYSKIVAVDEIGVWIENPNWKSRPKSSDDFVSHRSHVLVPWGVLISVAAFPDRKFPENSAVPESEAWANRQDMKAGNGKG